jgi:hypothetical protein
MLDSSPGKARHAATPGPAAGVRSSEPARVNTRVFPGCDKGDPSATLPAMWRGRTTHTTSRLR